jgi:hypothetical protein
MAIRNDFAPGEVLAAADLNDTFGSKLDLAGGKILQIVRATDTTVRETTSTSYVDVTGMSVTITPQKNDSAILVLASGFLRCLWSTGEEGRGRLTLTDNSDNALSGSENYSFGTQNLTATGTREVETPFFIIGRSTPATINATTYKLRFRSLNANTTTSVRNSVTTGQMYAIEVSA